MTRVLNLVLLLDRQQLWVPYFRLLESDPAISGPNGWFRFLLRDWHMQHLYTLI